MFDKGCIWSRDVQGQDERKELKNLVVKNLKIQNAQKMHVTFEKCVGVEVSGLTITAPADSPNTDGIHVTRTQNIQISSSVIGTGTLKTYPKTKLKIFSFLKKRL